MPEPNITQEGNSSSDLSSGVGQRHTSRTGLDWISLFLTRSTSPAWPLHRARYCSMYLEASGWEEGGRKTEVL